MSSLRFVTHPLTTRFRFKFRPLTNFVGLWLLFTAITFALAWWKWAMLVEAMLIAFLFYFNYFVLNKRAIGVTCGTCHDYIATNTPWICGFCEKKNERVDEYPFSNRCQHCSAEPKAYECHHCKEMIFFTRDQLSHGCARCAGIPVDTKVNEKQSRRDQMSRDIHEARLEAELAEKRRDRAKKERELAEEERARQETVNPNSKRRRELKELLDEARQKRKSRVALNKLKDRWIKETLADTTLSDEEKDSEIDEIKKTVEEARMMGL